MLSAAAGTADPKFPNSNNVFKISGDGVFIASRANGDIDPDGTCHYSNGYDANSGTAILNLIYSIGINCDWIHAGTLTLGGTNDVNGICSVLDAGGTEQVRLDKDGITVEKGTITGSTITSYRDGSTSNGYVQISGGSLNVYDDLTNYFRVTSRNDGRKYVVIGATNCAAADESTYIERPSIYFGWALEDAYNKHGSDKKLKKNIKDISIKKSKSVINAARPRYYEFKETAEGGVRAGVIAQEFREELDKFGDKTAIERESIRRPDQREVLYEDFIAHLINCTKDMYSEIDGLKAEIAELKARLK